jgi:7-cyano-7-deazaguanine synthase
MILVLLSGGVDSAACLARAIQQDDALALTVDIGQPFEELRAARRIANKLRVPRMTVRCDVYRTLGHGHEEDYIPARNTVLTSIALAVAEARGASRIFVGACALDGERFPDCRVSFFRAWSVLAQVATMTEDRIDIEAPLLGMNKRQVVEEARRLGVPLDDTFSCYRPRRGGACGECRSCRQRSEAGA